MVLILIEIWQFWLKENVRFWHKADCQIRFRLGQQRYDPLKYKGHSPIELRPCIF